MTVTDYGKTAVKPDHLRSPLVRDHLSKTANFRDTQCQFSENICSEDDLRSRIFGTFVKKFLTCLPLLGFSNILKMVLLPIFNGFLT